MRTLYTYVWLDDNIICFEAAVALMDDDLRERVHSDLAPCTEQEFMNEYCKRHFEKYGEWFEIN